METITQLLDGMTAKELEALAKKALRKAELKKEIPAEISPNDERIAPVVKAIQEANKALKLKSIDTIDLAMRKMKLGHSLVKSPRYAAAKKSAEQQ